MHGITSRKTDIVLTSNKSLSVLRRQERVSLTFRKLRRKECDCIYTSKCDSYERRLKEQSCEDETRLKEVAAKLEQEFVIDVCVF